MPDTRKESIKTQCQTMRPIAAILLFGSILIALSIGGHAILRLLNANLEAKSLQTSTGRIHLNPRGSRGGASVTLQQEDGTVLTFDCEGPGWPTNAGCRKWLPASIDSISTIEWIDLPSGLFWGKSKLIVTVSPVGARREPHIGLSETIFDMIVGQIFATIGIAIACAIMFGTRYSRKSEEKF